MSLPVSLQPAHLEDLRRSGLSDAMIEAMNLTSCSREDLQLLLNRFDFDANETGYRIPYTQSKGYSVRLMNGVVPMDRPDKRVKYLRPSDAEMSLYIPPGFYELAESTDYVIVTEGEKKAAKAVQEGFPCVAIAGVWNWMDKEDRLREKSLGLKSSYQTKPMAGLLDLAARYKIVLMFDSDCRTNRSVETALKTLAEALTWHTNARVFVSYVPGDVLDSSVKMGIDDFLVKQGTAAFQTQLDSVLVGKHHWLKPLCQFVYKQVGTEALSYRVCNSSKMAMSDIHRIQRQERNEESGEIKWVDVLSTRIWLNRVVHSIDDDTTQYEMAYVPLHESNVRYMTGGADLLNLSAKQALDHYILYGAKILGKEKNAMEEFWHYAQTYGIRNGAVRQVHGTRRRGWLPQGDQNWYIMANKVYTAEGVFASQSPDVPVLPIDAGGNEAQLREAFACKGEYDEWARIMRTKVLPNTTPTLFVSAAVAGLLRQFCPDSENFVIHLYSDSSSGKTTAMRAAAGIWGNPTQMIDMWRATDNGLEGRCVARNDMALFLDEAGMVQNEDIIKNSIYMIGNGNDKLRATRDGSERRARRFQLVTLSTGERALLRGERFAGQEVRTLEIPTHVTGSFWDKSINGSLEAEQLNQGLLSNYGFGADMIIPYILLKEQDEPGYFRKMHETYTAFLRTRVSENCPPHLLRRVKHYGSLLTAFTVLCVGALKMTEEEIRPIFERMANDIGRCMLQMSTDQFSGGEKLGMLEHFLNQIAANAGLHFHTTEAARGVVWGAITQNESKGYTEVQILPSTLNELVKPYDGVRVLAMLDTLRFENKPALLYAESRTDRKSSARINNQVTTCYRVNLDVVQQFLKSQGGLA